MKKKKIVIAGLAAIAAAAIIGNTWAVWTQEKQAGNEYMTAKYSTFLREDFDQDKAKTWQWLPGEEINKKVWVENESTIPVVVKVTMDQTWSRNGPVMAWIQEEEGKEPVWTEVVSKDDAPSMTFLNESGQPEYAAILNFNKEDVYLLRETSGTYTAARAPVGIGNCWGLKEVSDPSQAPRGSWLMLTDEPKEPGNFTFYYMGLLQPGEKTPLLLNSVRINPKLENTIPARYMYYPKDENGEYIKGADGKPKLVTMDTVNSKYGYDDCHYNLGVSMQTVQYTKDAVENIFHTKDPASSDPISRYIAGYIAGEGTFKSDTVKKLYFRERDGVMTYEPYRQPGTGAEEGNWFMSFTNMVPGGIYLDELDIENLSRKNYRLFMQIRPRNQSHDPRLDELLKMISMEVYYGDQMIYRGDATGYHGPDTIGENMQGIVPLGVYRKGTAKKIRVKLVLDPDLGLNDDGTYRYADILTKIDWWFAVEEIPDPPGNPRDPRDPQDPPPHWIPDEPVPTDMLTVIDDEGVPLTVLPDGDVPLAYMVPKTGDDFPIGPVAVTAAVSLLLMTVFGIMGFGEKKKAGETE